MFRRRRPRPFWQNLRHWLWPKGGWRRSGSYVVKRLTRLPGTPHSIAAGFACGTAISFTPFLGLHLIGGALLSFLVRGNYLASAVGTLVGNPATFPFIWLFSYELGHLLLGNEPRMPTSAEAWTLEWLLDNYGRLFWPMTVGGVPLGIAAGLAVYFPLTRIVAVFQNARRRRRESKRGGGRRRLGVEASRP